MQMALDLETINETYFDGFARSTPMGLVGDVKGFYVPFEEWPEEVKNTYRYDPEGAEALLDAAGYARGRRTVFDSNYLIATVTSSIWAI